LFPYPILFPASSLRPSWVQRVSLTNSAYSIQQQPSQGHSRNSQSAAPSPDQAKGGASIFLTFNGVLQRGHIGQGRLIEALPFDYSSKSQPFYPCTPLPRN
jgi:hypothetical protein